MAGANARIDSAVVTRSADIVGRSHHGETDSNKTDTELGSG